MEEKSRLSEQGSVLLWVGKRIGVPTAVVFGSLYAVALLSDIPFSSLSRDPATTYGYPWYGGAVSHFGVIVTLIGSAVGVLVAWTASRIGQRSIGRFAKWLGLGLFVFGLDDLLLLHEGVLPALLGVPELAILAFYPLGALLLVWRYGNLIIERTDFGLLAAALLLLGSQFLFDGDYLALPFSRAAAEDPLKITAMIILLVYLLRIFASVVEDLSSIGREPGSHPDVADAQVETTNEN